MQSSQLLKGTFYTMILKVLSQHGRMYGYEIAQRVKSLSGDEIIVNEGSLYPILHKMEEEGMVKAERINIGNRSRRYYTLTDSGTERVQVKIEEFEQFVQVVRKVLYPAST
ncbi:MAG: PadR family transcriptional regulator [Roseivirga sp.]